MTKTSTCAGPLFVNVSRPQNQLRRDAPAETRRSNSLLRGQATHEHFSIETSAVVTPVRTTVAPSEFLTQIIAPCFRCEEPELLHGTKSLVHRTAKLPRGTKLLLHRAASERQQ